MLHLADHRSLRSDDPSECFEDFPCRLPARLQNALSDFCRLVYVKHHSEGLRYAVTRNDGFLPNGDLKLDSPGTGFSCATLVKAIYDAQGQPLLQDNTWPLADNADREWFESHINRLREWAIKQDRAADVQHVDALDSACKWSRYKPEQVVYAATIAPPPAKYNDVKIPAELLMRKVRSTRPSLETRRA